MNMTVVRQGTCNKKGNLKLKSRLKVGKYNQASKMSTFQVGESNEFEKRVDDLITH